MQTHISKIVSTAIKQIEKNGYAVIKNFISAQQCSKAMQQIDRLVDNFQPTPQNITVFDSEIGQSKHRLSKYFLQSSDKVRFFFQPKAWQNGSLVVPKNMAINKIGHSLHQQNQIFQEITYSPGIWELCQEIGIKDPLVMQSMAILKPPKIGAKVETHQDSTFLYAQPQTLYGFWVPFQDATIQNGCIWGIPGSHKGPLYWRSKVINREPVDQRYLQYNFKEQDFVPMQMEKGSLAVFPGRFVHKSHDNVSNKSRYAYTWHLMDSGSKWSPHNWLQRPYFPKFVHKH